MAVIHYINVRCQKCEDFLEKCNNLPEAVIIAQAHQNFYPGHVIIALPGMYEIEDNCKTYCNTCDWRIDDAESKHVYELVKFHVDINSDGPDHDVVVEFKKVENSNGQSDKDIA